MARNRETIVYLDTHVVVWLYAGLLDKITDAAKQAIDESDLFISQLVRLELQYLYEIGRISAEPELPHGHRFIAKTGNHIGFAGAATQQLLHLR